MDKREMRFDLRKLAIIVPVAVGVACGPPPRAVVVRTTTPVSSPGAAVNPPAIVLGEMPVDQIIVPTRPATPLPLPSTTARISLTATNANVRELIPVLAAQAGISVIMTPDVKGRVSVYLRDVSPLEALRAVISEAELTVGEDNIPLPFGPTVFFHLPVNVNTASAAVLKARFGITDSTANWLVRARSW